MFKSKSVVNKTKQSSTTPSGSGETVTLHYSKTVTKEVSKLQTASYSMSYTQRLTPLSTREYRVFEDRSAPKSIGARSKTLGSFSGVTASSSKAPTSVTYRPVEVSQSLAVRTFQPAQPSVYKPLPYTFSSSKPTTSSVTSAAAPSSLRTATCKTPTTALSKIHISSPRITSPNVDKTPTYKNSLSKTTDKSKDLLSKLEADYKKARREEYLKSLGGPKTGGPKPATAPSPARVNNTKGSGKKKRTGKGLMIIFNHVQYKNDRNERRVGTEKDVANLKATFKQFNVEIRECTDYTVKQIQDTVKWLKSLNFKERPFLIVAILTHGGRHDMLCAKDGDYSINDDFLFQIIENESLATKPKIFIVQACKGGDLPKIYHDAVQQTRKCPQEVLKLQSTFEGFAAIRYEHGSPFIISLCDHIRSSGQFKDLEDIMKQVIKEVQEKAGQIASYTGSLTKRFVLGHYT